MNFLQVGFHGIRTCDPSWEHKHFNHYAAELVFLMSGQGTHYILKRFKKSFNIFLHINTQIYYGHYDGSLFCCFPLEEYKAGFYVTKW